MATAGTRTLRIAPCDDAAQGAAALAALLRQARPAGAGDLGEPAYLRLEQPLSSGDPLRWLRTHQALMRVYWRGRAFDLELAGVGVCSEHDGAPLEALDELLDLAGDEQDALRLVGSVRFDMERRPEREWAPFGRARFHLPLLEMRREGGRCELAVNLRCGRAALESGAFDAQRRTALRCLDGSTPPPPALARTALDEARDDPQVWRERVERILETIATGSLEKAVLARRAARAAVGGDPLELLEGLQAGHTRACHFLVQPSAQTAFLGASPEHLYIRDGACVASEAVAGTRPRGATPERDSLLAGDLLHSEKDLREHDHVQRHLLDRLAPLCEALEVPAAPEVLSLPTLHHLRTAVTGTLRPGVRDAALLAALHPTPAVCGTPPAAALERLRACEPFDRGLYAGPVGCFGRERSEVAVAIRSALWSGDSVQLYAGAGIVAGSDPDAEWQETVEKMRAIERLLGAARAS